LPPWQMTTDETPRYTSGHYQRVVSDVSWHCSQIKHWVRLVFRPDHVTVLSFDTVYTTLCAVNLHNVTNFNYLSWSLLHGHTNIQTTPTYLIRCSQANVTANGLIEKRLKKWKSALGSLNTGMLYSLGNLATYDSNNTL